MNNFTTISIDLEVYKLIQTNLASFDETPNEVLRRLLNIEMKPRNESKKEMINDIGTFNNSVSQSGYINWKGVNFRDGLKLRKKYQGKIINAEVKDGKFYCLGQFFDSPSAAGVHATGTSVNGWIFWEYLDENSGSWKLLDNLRKK
jgi:hypothetical protein